MAVKSKVVAATEAFFADVDGAEVLVHVGERFEASHPVVKAHGQWFEPDQADVKP